MTIARKEIVLADESWAYHCVSRCVRRAFLCGFDRLSGKDFSHRKDWIRERLLELSQIFSVDILGYAVMSNHLHVVLQTQVEQVRSWDDDEIARRWLMLFPKRRDKQGKACKPTAAQVSELTGNPERLHELRSRLCNVSWFMRCLNEPIARMANQEDGCKGRFWEGRFKCQRLLDEGAVLACMAYVDLNPVRAKAADSLEQSTHTSVHDRIIAHKAKKAVKHLRRQQKHHARKHTRNHKQKRELQLQQERAKAADWLQEFQSPVLELTLEEYLQLLDWTGRQIRAGKRGSLPQDLQPVLDRLDLDHQNWIKTVEGYGSLFCRVAGKAQAIAEAAGRAGRKWLKGLSGSDIAFVNSPLSSG